MSFSPNLKVLTDWRSSLNVAFSVLRRIKFIIEDDFSWGDFDPQTNFNGMTVTNYSVKRARYLKIWKFLWFSLDIRATLAAPFAATVAFTIPGTSRPNDEADCSQGGGAYMFNAGTPETGTWASPANTNVVNSGRPAGVVHTAGAYIFIANGFIEVT